MLATRAPSLAGAVLGGEARLLEPLADLLLLPLGMHGVLVAIALLAPAPLAAAAGAAGLAALLAYIAAILLRGPVGRHDLAALLAAPGYLAWKLALLPATLAHSRRAAAWTRSERAIECQGS
jgi:hypothetical protein